MEVKIQTEFIKLDSFLKFCGAASLGSEAKMYVLDELVKHIIPTGYAVNYVFYEKSGASVTNLAYNQVMNTLTEQDGIVSELREGEIKDDSMHDRLYGLSNAIEIYGAPNPTKSGT